MTPDRKEQMTKMGRLAIIRRLWKNRDLLLPLLGVLEQVIKSARTLGEIKEALKNGIDKGDLDAALDKFAAANKRAKDYVKTGR